MLCRAVFGVVAFGLLLTAAQSASAQQPKGTPIKIVEGKVSNVVPGQGLLITADGKQYAMFFDAKSKLSVSGTAGLDYVTPGSFIQLDCELDDKGAPVGEVTKLMIITPSNINQPGVFSEAGPDAKAGSAGKYFVRGTVKTNKANTMTVAAGPKQLTFKISSAVSVPVTVGDWTVASIGDSVNGSGQSFAAPGAAQAGAAAGPTPVWGEQVEIKAIMPITKKKKGRR